VTVSFEVTVALRPDFTTAAMHDERELLPAVVAVVAACWGWSKTWTCDPTSSPVEDWRKLLESAVVAGLGAWTWSAQPFREDRTTLGPPVAGRVFHVLGKSEDTRFSAWAV